MKGIFPDPATKHNNNNHVLFRNVILRRLCKTASRENPSRPHACRREEEPPSVFAKEHRIAARGRSPKQDGQGRQPSTRKQQPPHASLLARHKETRIQALPARSSLHPRARPHGRRRILASKRRQRGTGVVSSQQTQHSTCKFVNL